MPVKRKIPGIFYGWWVVIICFTCALTSGVVGYGFTAFFNPIALEFGWTYAAISLAASLRGAETGILSPVLGFIIDRWSPKWVLLTGAFIISLGVFFLSRVSSLAQFYGAWFVIAIGTSCLSSSVVNPAISYWFRRDLGKAMGFLNTGYALSGLLVPVLYLLIQSFGWRQALVIMGAVFLVVCVPLVWIMKDRPERYGYLPDGDAGADSATKSDIRKTKTKTLVPEVNINTGQALKSRTFWFLTLALTLQSITYIAVVNHIMPYLKTVNIEGSTASFFAGAIPVISILGRLATGWLSDRYSGKQIAVVSFIFLLGSTLLFDSVRGSNLWLLVLTVLIFSISTGSLTVLRAILTIEYFGKSRFASIFGVLIGITSLGAMLGPFLAGWTYDMWQSYHYAWWIFTAVNVIGLAFMVLTPRISAERGVAEAQRTN